MNVADYKLTKEQNRVLDSLLQLNRNTVLLEGDTGFGKSVVSLHYADILHAQTVVYITEANLIPSVPQFTGLNVYKLKYSQFKHKTKSKKAILKVAKDLLKETNYQTEKTLFIFDECHNIANGKHSQQGNIFLALNYLTPHCPKLLMSATPVPSGNQNIIPYLACNFFSCDSFDQFLEKYQDLFDTYVKTVYMPNINRWAYKYEDINIQDLTTKLDKMKVTGDKKRKSDIDIYVYKISCQVTDKVKQFHKKLKKHSKVQISDHQYVQYTPFIGKMLGDGIFPVYSILKDVDMEYRMSAGNKTQKVLELVKNRASKTLVLCAFIKSAELVYNYLTENGIKCILYDKKQETVENFKNNGCQVLVGTVAGLSTGYNLDECNTTIFYSMDDNFKNFYQSAGRMDRVVSTQNKAYYFLVTPFDEQTTYQNIKNKNEKAKYRGNFHFDFRRA